MAFNPRSPEGHTAWDYAETLVHLLGEIEKAVESGQGEDPIVRRVPFNIVCDASGNGQFEVDLPLGTTWELNGIAFTAGATGYVATYANEESSFSLLKVNQSSQIVSDDFVDTVLSDDRKVVIVARQQPASQQVVGNIRLKQYQTSSREPQQVA